MTQAMATPPSGLDYGYRPGDPAPQAGEPRRQNGTRSHARPDGGSQGSGGYRATVTPATGIAETAIAPRTTRGTITGG